MIRNIAAGTVLVAAALAASAGTALASAPGITLAVPAAHSPFVVADNGGALITREPLHVGQVIYSAGIAYTVRLVHPFAGVAEFTVTPALPASDIGHMITFMT